MKKSLLYYFVALFIFPIAVYAQDAPALLDKLQANTQSVKGKKVEYSQEFIKSKEQPFLITINITESSKGEVSSYSLNTRDLNAALINFETKGEFVLVNTQVKGGKKLVKVVENGEQKNYDSKVVFYATDIEQARVLTDALKSLVELAEKQGEDIGVEAKAKSDISAFIASSVTDVVINSNTYKQSLVFDASNANILKFSIEDMSKGTTELFSVNAADLNLHKVDFETNRNEVYVYLTTKGDAKLISYIKTGVLSNYTNQFQIKMNSVEEARLFAHYMKQFVKISEEEETVNYGNYSYEKCVGFLTANIGEAVLNQDAYKQTFSMDKENELLFNLQFQDVSKGTTASYSANAADLLKGKTSFNTKGNAVFIDLATTNNVKLIQVTEGSSTSAYTNTMTLRAKDVENARALAEVITRFKELAHEKMSKKVSFSGVTEAEKYILSSIGEVLIGTDTYTQSIEINKDNNCIYTFNITDVSKNTLMAFEFNFRDMDIHKIQFDTKGSQVIVSLETKGKNKLIKTYKNGEVDKYTYAMEILTKSIEEARNIVSALKSKAESCVQ